MTALEVLVHALEVVGAVFILCLAWVVAAYLRLRWSQ